MWAENGGWISLSCKNTLTCGIASYGVENDGSGLLSGFAWAENGGWINFAPSTGGVSIDMTTGDFSGRAWAGGSKRKRSLPRCRESTSL